MKTSRNDNIRMLAVSLVGALGLLAASCSKDPQADVPGGGSAGTGKTITATFDLTRDFGQSITVKADGSEDISTIKDLWVIQMATCVASGISNAAGTQSPAAWGGHSTF